MKLANMDNRGFTLIEVVVTIIVSAILAVLLVQVMSGHISRSYWALEKIDDGLVLREVIEIINADYRRLLTEDPRPLVTLERAIQNGDYWADSNATITVEENDCLVLDKTPTGGSGHGESGHKDCEHPVDRLLKVTLSYEDHSLTTLFSR